MRRAPPPGCTARCTSSTTRFSTRSSTTPGDLGFRASTSDRCGGTLIC
jgi:hypothetical protein